MKKNIDTDKYSIDKIILLGVFGFSLAIAYLIVINRSAVLLSSPIKLAQTGLSVAMPSGNGWKSEKNWQYVENSFVLNSLFYPSPIKAQAIIQCRYSLSDQTEDLDTFFAKKAQNLGGKIIKTNQLVAGNLTADWILVENPKLMSKIIFAVVKLQPSRTLYIESHQLLNDGSEIERVFTKIVKSIKFEKNALLQNGMTVLAGMKKQSIANILENQNLQSSLLVKDCNGNAIGFCVSVILDTRDDSNLPIQAASHTYFREKQQSDNITFFQTNDNLTTFSWKGEKTSGSGIFQTRINLDKSGSLVIEKSGRATTVEPYKPKKTPLPKILLPLIFKEMTTSKENRIMLDIIDNNGDISPAIIDTYPAKNPQFRIEFPSSQLTYEQTKLSVIIKMFPERAELLLHKKMIWQAN